ncbi:hypothetical protein C8R44DRAFT_848163 [Mycena epipterygia]|nr:hypothetical protein C8R44DRAFT_848163 [Mycena epipterygia]
MPSIDTNFTNMCGRRYASRNNHYVSYGLEKSALPQFRVNLWDFSITMIRIKINLQPNLLSTVMPPVRLAQEMLASIVDQVQERRTLKACSLVARSFVFPSQRHLFRRQPTGTDYLTVVMPFQTALALFTMSPHLITHVKDLYLGLRLLQDCHAAQSVLRIASEITLLGIFGNGVLLDWNTISPSLSTLLKDIALRSTVRSLNLEQIKGIPTSLIHSPPFRALSLTLVNLEEDITSTSPFIPAPLDHSSGLEHLTIGVAVADYTKTAIEMDMRGRLAKLRKLSLLDIRIGNDERWPRLTRFLLESNFRPSLEHLELSFITLVPELAPISFPALKSLEIGLDIHTMTPPADLDSAFAHIHTVAPLLEYLSFTVHTRFSFSLSWPQKSTPFPLFASMDFAIVLPSLRVVHCSLHTNGFEQAGFEQYVRDRFPGPKEAGILICSII